MGQGGVEWEGRRGVDKRVRVHLRVRTFLTTIMMTMPRTREVLTSDPRISPVGGIFGLRRVFGVRRAAPAGRLELVRLALYLYRRAEASASTTRYGCDPVRRRQQGGQGLGRPPFSKPRFGAPKIVAVLDAANIFEHRLICKEVPRRASPPHA